MADRLLPVSATEPAFVVLSANAPTRPQAISEDSTVPWLPWAFINARSAPVAARVAPSIMPAMAMPSDCAPRMSAPPANTMALPATTLPLASRLLAMLPVELAESVLPVRASAPVRPPVEP